MAPDIGVLEVAPAGIGTACMTVRDGNRIQRDMADCLGGSTLAEADEIKDSVAYMFEYMGHWEDEE
ncbi:hypothetical protein SCP_0402390 [Sparassis crispa]|uniref:Uncharacterized protein n=1 Tax=Sparassis crispa TaxID=139825 RepID=A0A401GID8_9APHY|nr:hypothetical protein SCP_0402390 [Sparassis crispa]GBE81865.1 hypothetical protein SCP_0402390 [Sparassis crispa]